MRKNKQSGSNTRGKKFGIVVAEFNDYITKQLLNGCLIELSHLGIKHNQITTVWVPGAFEIPVTALKIAKNKSINAVICLGAVIRGETLHFELVAQGVAQGITQVSLLTGKPIIFGVLAADRIDQAQKRAQVKGLNRGKEAAQTAVKMVNLLNRI